MPWPISTAPLQIVTRPSRSSVRRISLGFGNAVLPQPYHMQAMPTPRLMAGVRSRCARSHPTKLCPMRVSTHQGSAADLPTHATPAPTPSRRRDPAR